MFRLDCLSSEEQRALEDDLRLASRIQDALLPCRRVRTAGWEVSYHYRAAGVTSGDYCDVVRSDNGSLYFIIGDVTGKGLAASILMAHLHATFRALAPLSFPLDQLVERANKMFCESTLSTHFATLVCGRADPHGEIAICNAGHLPPLLVRDGKVTEVHASGVPIGAFSDERYSVRQVSLDPGDMIVLYTDGLSEAFNPEGQQYGDARLHSVLREHHHLPPDQLTRFLREDLKRFRSGLARSDDLTIMVIRRLEARVLKHQPYPRRAPTTYRGTSRPNRELEEDSVALGPMVKSVAQPAILMR